MHEGQIPGTPSQLPSKLYMGCSGVHYRIIMASQPIQDAPVEEFIGNI